MLLEGLIVAYTVYNTSIWLDGRRESFNPSPLVELKVPVSVVVPAWSEPESYIKISLQSIRDQSVVKAYPNLFEVILVDGGVTRVAYKYVDRVFKAPRGKLNARHIGIVESRGEIIFACDADTYYPPNWMNAMLKPFSNPGVVGVCAAKDMGLLEPSLSIPKNMIFKFKMSGRASAFRRWAYFKSGGFNLNVNQLNVGELTEEEEYRFIERLKKVGEIVFMNAPVMEFGARYGRGLRA